TVYRGNLFVGDLLLNESGMQNHPLTPMRDANLVRTLQRQSRSPVGLLRYDVVQRGVAAVNDARAQLMKGGVRLAIADAISDADLYTLGEACAGDLLVTGGSGLALGLPGNFARAGRLDTANDAQQLPAVMGRSVVLAGSCSRATQAQVAHWRDSGKPAFRLDPLALADDEQRVIDDALAFARQRIDHEPVLIYATSAPEEVASVQQTLGTAASGELVERALASIARGVEAMGVRRFVVAGGETSGSVVNALRVTSLVIGPQIDPGVPWTVSDGARHALALKSGNFGTVDFFEKALAQFDRIAESSR
ncbi:MAG TPA: 3-oxo-tetronate kinase, partial [Paraburkholderia sp.]